MSRATGPLIALGWIGTALFGALAAIELIATLLGSFTSPAWLNIAGFAALAGSSVLLMPSLWQNVRRRWLNVVRVVFALVLAYVGLFALPVESHAIKIDLPRPMHN
jgi:hypothetical protein